jgi:hypothetical protein
VDADAGSQRSRHDVGVGARRREQRLHRRAGVERGGDAQRAFDDEYPLRLPRAALAQKAT